MAILVAILLPSSLKLSIVHVCDGLCARQVLPEPVVLSMEHLRYELVIRVWISMEALGVPHHLCSSSVPIIVAGVCISTKTESTAVILVGTITVIVFYR